jgi:hypothetical protein
VRHQTGWRRLAMAGAAAFGLAALAPGPIAAQGAAAVAQASTVPGLVRIEEAAIREWLGVIASDQMQGRAAFTDGYARAAAYVAGELQKMGAVPLGAAGSFLQPVERRSYRVTRNSTVTVEVDGQTRTFQHGEHVLFAPLAGSRQTLRFTGVDFAGYGLPSAGETIAEGRLVVLLPGVPSMPGRRWPYPSSFTSVFARAESLVQNGTGAAIVFGAVPATGGSNARENPTAIDLTTVLRVDRPRAPVIRADETVLRLLLAGAPLAFDELQAKARRGEPLESFTLPGVTVTIAIDHTYDPVDVDRSHNVVAMVPGADPALRETYVLFGAHLDHVGMAQQGAAPGRVVVPVSQDAIWNGADDDGSGSSALLAIARAMLTGPRPRRSTVFVWHTAEEEGLFGSLAFTDDPPLALAAVQAQINIDMIGRNRDDDPALGNTVYTIGADRISTDLHNLIEAVNERQAAPLAIDYHYNDPDDTESFYTRSDHYSYASRGIPVAFFFTGPHPDYHANTDSVDRILFPKLVRIAQLIYEVGHALADRTEPLRRDHQGPRAGRGFTGQLPVGPAAGPR